MANMSFLNGPDARTLGLVAGALAVDEAFVEKDWYIVQAISTLVACGTADITPIFSGGTALLKGHGLIRRFSEDIDFKLALSAEFEAMSPGQRRTVLSDLKRSEEPTSVLQSLMRISYAVFCLKHQTRPRLPC